MVEQQPIDSALARVEAELASPSYRVGEALGKWERVEFSFPILVIKFRATDSDGSLIFYNVRFEMSGFPALEPEAQLWDTEAKCSLDNSKRPKGNERVTDAFKAWSENGVIHIYRPWERAASKHSGFKERFPELAWNPKKPLTFILEDISGLLNLNARLVSPR